MKGHSEVHKIQRANHCSMKVWFLDHHSEDKRMTGRIERDINVFWQEKCNRDRHCQPSDRHGYANSNSSSGLGFHFRNETTLAARPFNSLFQEFLQDCSPSSL